MLIEKTINDLQRALLIGIPFFTIAQQQGKQYTGFFDTVKRQRCKEAVVYLELTAYKVLKLR
jgi:hypothetical protein